MSDAKKYYYIRLKENFFDSNELVAIESLPDGYKYSNILLKMYLRSLRREGKLMVSDSIPFDSKILAKTVGHSKKTVEKAVKLFEELGLIEVLDSGAMFMLNIQEFIGESSSEGDRKRKYRARINQEKIVDKCPDERPPEIETEKEKELKLDIESEPDYKNVFELFCKKVRDFYPEKKLNKTAAFEGWKNLFCILWEKQGDWVDSFNTIGYAVWQYLKDYKEANTKNGRVDWTYLCFLSSLFGDKYETHLAPYIEEAASKVATKEAGNSDV